LNEELTSICQSIPVNRTAIATTEPLATRGMNNYLAKFIGTDHLSLDLPSMLGNIGGYALVKILSEEDFLRHLLSPPIFLLSTKRRHRQPPLWGTSIDSTNLIGKRCLKRV
jgi:hypothetical protein